MRAKRRSNGRGHKQVNTIMDMKTKTTTFGASNARKSAPPATGFFRSTAIFFRGFLDHPRMVASIIPSSRSTINALLDRVDWERCRLFVEYGPGVGTFTSHILERLPPDGALLAIDTNPRFIAFLEQTFDDPRFHAVLGSAADVEKFVKASGHDNADYILSGLPFSALSDAQGQEIVDRSHAVLREGGAFMTYQFRPQARRLTEKRFFAVDTGIALMNVPPCLLTWGWKR
jgi:phospholipid N-methyltransferase